MKKIFLTITIVLSLLLLVTLSATAQNKISQARPVYVFLNFEGDPNFPSLTYQYDTTGLARFTGSAFRLTPQDRDWVVKRIMELLNDKFVYRLLTPLLGGSISYNIKFVTNTAGLDPDSYYTWGIDDSPYLYQDPGYICPARLWGKAGGNPSSIGPNKALPNWAPAQMNRIISSVNDPLLIDVNGKSIYHPKHARTWAGSFTLTKEQATCPPSIQVGDFSIVPLILWDRCTWQEINDWDCGKFGDGTNIELNNIAMALATSAAHEIAHLFGALHVLAPDTIMNQELERDEARELKGFDTNNAELLHNALSEAPRLATSFDAPTVTDTGTGMMWTKDANLPATLRVCDLFSSYPSGAIDSYNAVGYVDCLGYGGYRDWRLPSALNWDGTGPCLDDAYNLSFPYCPYEDYGYCTNSELGHIYYDMLGNVRRSNCYPPPFNTGPFRNLTRTIYWSLAPGTFWLFDFYDGKQVQTTSQGLLYAWPVRDAYKLIDNGDGTITDTSTGLMWIKDVHFGGQMAWSVARDWAENLIYAGYDDWRLPETREPDATCEKPEIFSGVIPIPIPMGCSLSEMGNLYNRWGIRETSPEPFILAGRGNYYWSGTEWASYPDSRAWVINFTYGEQGPANKPANAYAWAVREIKPGDTSPGADVRVEPAPNVSVTFSAVTSQGSTTVETSQNNPESGMPGFQFLGTFYDVTTTSVYDGAIHVCFTYQDSDIPQGTDEKDLEIMHWVEYYDFWSNSYVREWRNVTDRPYPDTVNNIICGTVGSLSWFGMAVAVKVKGDLDGDNDVDQNDVNIVLANRNQPASVCPTCDLDGDGMITALDARKLVTMCTRPRCATQ